MSMKKIMGKVTFYVGCVTGAIAVLFIKLTFLIAKGGINAFGDEKEQFEFNELLSSMRSDFNEDEEMPEEARRFFKWLVCC